MLKELRVYLDTSVIIALADPLDGFHRPSTIFVNGLIDHEVECLSGNPLVMELGKLVEAKGTKRCLDIISSMEEFGIHLKNTDMKQTWRLPRFILMRDC